MSGAFNAGIRLGWHLRGSIYALIHRQNSTYRAVAWAAAAPVDGTWSTGDFVFNSAGGSTFGWNCTAGGTPGTWLALAGGTGAPTDATYVTLSPNATLTNERVLTAGTNITITDNGAGNTVVIDAAGGSGDSVSVNGTACTDCDLDDDEPAPPADALNVIWQIDTGVAPDNVSAHVTGEGIRGLIRLHSDGARLNYRYPNSPLSARQWGMITPNPTGSSTQVNEGRLVVANSGGTLSVPTLASGALLTSLFRTVFTTAAGANSTAGFTGVSGANQCWAWRGDASTLGGFFYEVIFGLPTSISTLACNFGLWNTIGAATAYSQLGAHTDFFGIGCVDTDTNLQIITNDSGGSVTFTDLGANFPKSSTTNVYQFIAYCAPNASGIDYYARELTSGNTASGTISSNIPTNTTFLGPVAHISNRGSGTPGAVAFAIMSTYLETPLVF